MRAFNLRLRRLRSMIDVMMWHLAFLNDGYTILAQPTPPTER